MTQLKSINCQIRLKNPQLYTARNVGTNSLKVKGLTIYIMLTNQKKAEVTILLLNKVDRSKEYHQA